MNLLSVENISFAYNSLNPVICNISFNINAKEHIALVGPNGSGKSTLFQLLSGFFTPTHGQILFAGKKIHSISASERAKRISVVPQGTHFNFPYTALETVLMGLFPHRLRFASTSDTDLERAREIMQSAKVWEFAQRPVTELSGGQLQRVILARSLLQALPDNRCNDHSPLLLLDEAFSELDIAARMEMMQLVDVAVKEQGVTVIGIHHDLHLANKFAHRIIAIKDGKIAADGTPDKVFTKEFFDRVFDVKAEIIPQKGFLFV
ncbi:MAG: ABC transporter ATP-binding protein [Termitinemataceae bacterium]|nr:MAG: ABC transporter ATP-binding protein [Termitinemataceae bacterium]